jgi:para-aminobenzoate synthetase component I
LQDMTRSEFVSKLNEWGGERLPFLFITDFELLDPMAIPLHLVSPSTIAYSINGFTNFPQQSGSRPRILSRNVIPFQRYERMFAHVLDRLSYGDSYLTNLTCKTEISLSHSLREVFASTYAKYKLWYEDKFVVFSPECFVRVEDGKIFSFPMKGTIDASTPDAERQILGDGKELAEHVTIVDLIRNDLSQVADNVHVRRFRYLEHIRTNEKDLLQVSSEICGELPADYRKRIGDILMTLLPAGSVSGAPKEKTLQIIREAEMENRGYYTGVFGYFDGDRLDSGVMIRYMENDNGTLYYRSGGGLTTQSTAEKEYQELIDKVYVPVT